MTSNLSPIHSGESRVIASENQVKDALEVNWAQYDGERVIASNGGAIYLVKNGQLQWIPDPATYNNLFVSWNGVVVSDYLINSIPHGPALATGAILAKGGSATVYLITNNQKQGIPDMATFNKFYFNSKTIVTLPQIVVDYLPTGPNVG
ncbi:hypothetical protein SAMN04515620_13231 [Collimonas sp. OK607]|uniref:hypothetical protein n=1 Tax=Collimonas sp. OK607 TaxID=1798194 RepID=UPI0008E61BD8|nr:hypothetical protein [Collimonas sp. OK607]SFB26223.1 hypothetical protein SAMN04515620_13231 [Collimonas sp. OK607]